MSVKPFKKRESRAVDSLFAGVRADRRNKQQRNSRDDQRSSRASFEAREELLQNKVVVVSTTDPAQAERLTAFRTAVKLSNKFAATVNDKDGVITFSVVEAAYNPRARRNLT